ncbi:MAG TPA: T9SS type A sorting domain-containing protein [Flavobacteriales bacterium]|nr:T9SS type A sorting domain-containing protein [Flavobacteriales bacterium]
MNIKLQIKILQLIILRSILILFLGISSNAFSQSFYTNWAYPIGGPSYDFGLNNCIDLNNNVYTLGVFSDSLVLGDGQTQFKSNGRTDFYIIKHDTTGAILWAKSFGGTEYDGAGAVVVIEFQVVPFPCGVKTDSSGNVYVFGNYAGTVDFDPGADDYFLTADEFTYGFILKLNPEGDFVFAKSYESTYFQSFDVSESSIYLGGTLYQTVDFDQGPGEHILTNTGQDAFLLKLSNDGDFQNAMQLFSSGYAGVNQIEVNDENQAVYISGAYKSDLDLDSSMISDPLQQLTSQANTDGFVAKLGVDLDVVEWVKKMNCSSDGILNELSINSSEDIILSGRFKDTMTVILNGIVNQIFTQGLFDSFILKVNPEGHFEKILVIGDSNSNSISAQTLDPQNRIYISGSLKSPLNITFPDETILIEQTGLRNSYVLIIDSDLNYINHFTAIGGNYICDIEDIGIGLSNEINLTGTFTDNPTMSYDPTSILATYQGDYDGIQIQVIFDFLENSTDSEDRTGIKIYPNPVTDCINFDIKTTENLVSVQLLDATGRLILQQMFTSIGTQTLSLRGLAKGIYYCRLSKDGIPIQTAKVVKVN